jgi:hypothetical protein
VGFGFLLLRGLRIVTGRGLFVQSWQTGEGLPGNAVEDVLQDKDGFLWLATIGGLVRFDGVTFKPFNSPLITRVAARNIRALAETADGTLLLLPAVGGMVQLKAGQFSAHPVAEGLAGKQFQTLFVDGGGAVWLGAADGGVRRWKNGKFNDFGPTNGLSRRALVGQSRQRFAGRIVRLFEPVISREFPPHGHPPTPQSDGERARFRAGAGSAPSTFSGGQGSDEQCH